MSNILITTFGATWQIVPGDELDAFAWMDQDEILSLPLEIWSRLALNLLDAKQG